MNSRTTPLLTVIIAVFTVGFSWGIIIPVTSVILEGKDIPTPLIGITAAAIFIGMALGAPLVGRAIELYGIKRTLLAGMFGAGMLMIALALWTSLPVWIALRVIIGISFAAITTSCETLINRISTEKNRGRNLGFYAFAFSLSLMIAPVALWFLKFGTWIPFVAGGVICFTTTFFVSLTIPHVQEELPESSFDLQLVRRITLSLATNFMAGFMEGALIALLPVYALRQGFNTGQTSMLFFAFMLGHGGGPPLIGMFADRLGLRRILAVVYGVGTMVFIGILFFPAYITSTLLLLLAGASVGALYPLAVGLIGEVLSSSELPRGNAMTTFAYGIGSIIGPLFPALIMHLTIPKSLFVVAAVLYSVVFVIMKTSRSKMNS
jgi:MFS family permease